MLNQQGGPFAAGDDFFTQTLLAVSTGMAFVSIPAGMFIFKKRLEGIEKRSLDEKIATYRSAMIVRAATMEGAGFFFVICFALVGSAITLAEIVMILALMYFFFPNNSRIASEIKHDIRELEKLSGN